MPIELKACMTLPKSVWHNKTFRCRKKLINKCKMSPDAFINLKETIKLLWRHRNKCQNSGDIFKYITASYRLDSASSFNNIEGIRSLQNCSRWLACYILGSLKVKQSKVSNNWLIFQTTVSGWILLIRLKVTQLIGPCTEVLTITTYLVPRSRDQNLKIRKVYHLLAHGFAALIRVRKRPNSRWT